MGIQHIRNPYSLDDDHYGEFCDKMKEFLADDRSLPHRPEHMVADQITLADNYNSVLDAFHTAQNTANTATTDAENAIKVLTEKIRWMQIVLPTLTPGNDDILKPFGLDKSIPDAYAAIKNYADAIWAKWEEIGDEQVFVPLKADIDKLDNFIKAFESARDSQITFIEEAHQRQNEKDSAREAHNKLERAIFTWYRSNYTNPHDNYWTDTPWGKAPAPKLPAPKNFAYDKVAEKFSWDTVADADEYEVQYSEHGKDDDWTTLYKGAANETNNKPSEPDVYDFRVRGFKGENEGNWSKEIVVNFPEGGALPAPTMLMYDQFRNQFTWMFVAGATGYELEIDDGIIGWVQLYKGPKNHVVHDLHDGVYKVRVRAYRGAELSDWSHTIEVSIIFPDPEDLEYNSGSKRFEWKKSTGATIYHLIQKSPREDVYMGPDTECKWVFQGTRLFRVRAGDEAEAMWGEWSEWLDVSVPA